MLEWRQNENSLRKLGTGACSIYIYNETAPVPRFFSEIPFYVIPTSLQVISSNETAHVLSFLSECSFSYHSKSFLLMRQHMFQYFLVLWVSNYKIWIEWGQNEGEKNQGHLPCYKNFLIPPSFKSLSIIPGWENQYSSIISFILRSFSIWMTIEWLDSHFTMTQSDRDDQGMRVIKIFSIKSFSPLNSFPYHSIILCSFWHHFF